MSWYKDPQLFIYSFNYVYRIRKQFGVNPVLLNDLEEGEYLCFLKHLSLGNDKETDFEAFGATFPQSGIHKFINCQGLVIYWDNTMGTGTWSLEEHNSPFWSLPGITQQVLAHKQALEAHVSVLEVENAALKAQANRDKDENASLKDQVKRNKDLEAENAALKAQVNIDKDEKEAMNKRVLELEAENAVLKAEPNRERYVDAALKGEDVLAAGLEALEKQVSELTSKLMLPQEYVFESEG